MHFVSGCFVCIYFIFHVLHCIFLILSVPKSDENDVLWWMRCQASFCSAGYHSLPSTSATPSASATTCSKSAPSVESIRSSSRCWPGSVTSTVSSTLSSTPSSTTTSDASSSRPCSADGDVPRDLTLEASSLEESTGVGLHYVRQLRE